MVADGCVRADARESERESCWRCVALSYIGAAEMAQGRGRWRKWRGAVVGDGSCRHSGNQGTTGRPARAHDTLQKILPRTRLSKPGEPREGPLLKRTSRMLLQILLRTRLSKPGEPREGPLLERAPRVPPWILPRTKRSFARPPGLARVLSARSYLCPRQDIWREPSSSNHASRKLRQAKTPIRNPKHA